MKATQSKKTPADDVSSARKHTQPEIEKLSRLIFTPLSEAVQEIKHRHSDAALLERVRAYVNNDVPSYFDTQTPVFYLQRFIATPNFELLHTAEMIKPFGLPLIVGQDFRSKFSTNNELKLPLGKLPVVKGISHNNDEIIEYFTLFDFNAHNGKPLEEIQTKFGVPLIDFHKELLEEILLPHVRYVDESNWVDRNYRNDIYEQYKRIWALLCVHGVMLESYVPADYSFFTHVVYPTFKEVEAELGVTPLVVEHIPPELEPRRNWNAYPSYLYQNIKRRFGTC